MFSQTPHQLPTHCWKLQEKTHLVHFREFTKPSVHVLFCEDDVYDILQKLKTWRLGQLLLLLLLLQVELESAAV